MVLRSLNCCLSEKFWFLHQILRGVLLGIVFLAVGSSLSSLYVSCHSLLACRVSVEKSADSLMGVLLYVIRHFSLFAFNILSVFNFFQFDYYVFQCFLPWVYPACVCVCMCVLRKREKNGEKWREETVMGTQKDWPNKWWINYWKVPWSLSGREN